MNDIDKNITFPNRDFVAMVRAELAAAGRPDIMIERNWIDENQPGYAFLLHVPVGTELTVPLMAMDGFFDTRTNEDRKSYAVEFAKALINLKSAEAMLTKYARDVRRAANAAVAAARADGLDILLDRVGFKPTYACHLTYEAWRDAALHVLAEVTIRHTSFYLRPTTSILWVEEPAEVEKELQDIVEEQRELQYRMAELDAGGYDLVVDQITLDLLEAHGFDTVETLTRVWKEQCVNLKAEHAGHDVSLSLISFGGVTTASIQLQDAIWNGEHLWFLGDEHMKDHKHLIGKSVGDLVRHPVFASRPIVNVFNRHTDHVVFDLSQKVMFDADTGRLWREERLAA